MTVYLVFTSSSRSEFLSKEYGFERYLYANAFNNIFTFIFGLLVSGKYVNKKIAISIAVSNSFL